MAKFIHMKTMDGKIYKVDEKVAMKFSPVKSLVEFLGDLEEKEILPFACIDSDTFDYVIEWANHHIDDPIFEETYRINFEDAVDAEISDWDRDFFKKIPMPKLFEIIRGCNYLGMHCLSNIICKIIKNIVCKNDHTKLQQIFQKKKEFPTKVIEELSTELKKLKSQLPKKMEGIYDLICLDDANSKDEIWSDEIDSDN